jgi:nickel/cobalt exporter
MRLRLLAFAACFLIIVGAPALNEPFIAHANASASTNTDSEIGPLDRATIWVYQQQRKFHRELTTHLRKLSQDGDWRVALALIGASFLYGLLHAAGPGHGKVVMTGYLVTHRETVRRGVMLATAAAFCQGLVAIFIVYGLISLAGWLPRETQSAVTWSERMSFALVSLVGAYLLYRGAKGLWRRVRTSPQCRHHHDHDHVHDESCGHVHMPDADVVAKANDWKTMAGVVLSIGIRPCTGAVIVLVFAKAVALAWVGMGAVLAMSAGTALAIASLAAASVGIRNLAVQLPVTPSKYLGHAADVAAALGGVVILIVGISLLSTAFGPAHPIMG